MKVLMFMTFGVSLRDWQDQGLLSREISLYRRYVEHGHAVEILSYGDTGDEAIAKDAGMTVCPAYRGTAGSKRDGVNFLRSLFLPFKMKASLRAAEVYKTNQMNGAWVAVLAKALYRKPLVVRCGYEWYRNKCDRGNVGRVKRTFTWLMSWIAYRNADVILISNQSDADYIQQEFGVDGERVVVHRNYIDTDLFSPGSLPPRRKAMIYVGRVIRRKNLHLVVEALRGTPYELDIVGSGPAQQDLERQAKESGVTVRFLGQKANDELPEILNRYAVSILASRYENNPKSLLEAMACARVVVGSDVEGIHELIEDGVTGYLCEPNAATLRDTITKAMTEDTALLSSIGAAAREFVVGACSPISIWKREEAVMRSLCTEGGRQE